MKKLYAFLCVLGLVLPYYFFVPFVLSNGLNIRLLISELFANQASAFFAADVIVSSVVLWVFIYQETQKRRIRLWWLCIVANFAVGVSLGLPLFLWLRQIEIEKEK
ncbi:MAG TPA: DUF2834 domain-containing protein [Blastocatellia bacterium]|nr:DUF2834 domain-containing protein [Blastocatellia bacterium]